MNLFMRFQCADRANLHDVANIITKYYYSYVKQQLSAPPAVLEFTFRRSFE